MGKHWWKDKVETSQPFTLPRVLAERLKGCIARQSRLSGDPEKVKYLWIYLDSDGNGRSGKDHYGAPKLTLDNWLSVVDEASSLGVNWLILCVANPLSDQPDVWKLCEWAQSVHNMSVGLHFAKCVLSVEDGEILQAHLDPNHTYLFFDKGIVEDMCVLEEKGFRVWTTENKHTESLSICDIPESMVCVGSDGTLYTCGLVLGDARFSLGSVQDRELISVVEDDSLPHIIPEEIRCAEDGCDHCLPLLVTRVLERQT